MGKSALNAPTKPKRGRPSKYSKRLADKICERIMQGKALPEVAKSVHVAKFSILRWLQDKPDFCARYTRAREAQADLLAEEIVSIADELEIEAKHQGETVTFDVSATAVQRNRLRVDARKWYASKLAPKKYGNRLNATVSGPDGGPVQVQAKATTNRALAAPTP